MRAQQKNKIVWAIWGGVILLFVLMGWNLLRTPWGPEGQWMKIQQHTARQQYGQAIPLAWDIFENHPHHYRALDAGIWLINTADYLDMDPQKWVVGRWDRLLQSVVEECVERGMTHEDYFTIAGLTWHRPQYKTFYYHPRWGGYHGYVLNHGNLQQTLQVLNRYPAPKITSHNQGRRWYATGWLYLWQGALGRVQSLVNEHPAGYLPPQPQPRQLVSNAHGPVIDWRTWLSPAQPAADEMVSGTVMVTVQDTEGNGIPGAHVRCYSWYPGANRFADVYQLCRGAFHQASLHPPLQVPEHDRRYAGVTNAYGQVSFAGLPAGSYDWDVMLPGENLPSEWHDIRFIQPQPEPTQITATHNNDYPLTISVEASVLSVTATVLFMNVWEQPQTPAVVAPGPVNFQWRMPRFDDNDLLQPIHLDVFCWNRGGSVQNRRVTPVGANQQTGAMFRTAFNLTDEGVYTVGVPQRYQLAGFTPKIVVVSNDAQLRQPEQSFAMWCDYQTAWKLWQDDSADQLQPHSDRFARAYPSSPLAPFVAYNSAIAWARTGRRDRAKTAFNRILSHIPESHSLHKTVAHCLELVEQRAAPSQYIYWDFPMSSNAY